MFNIPSFSSTLETSMYSLNSKILVNLRAAIPLWTTSASVTSVISPVIHRLPSSIDTVKSSLVNPATASDS